MTGFPENSPYPGDGSPPNPPDYSTGGGYPPGGQEGGQYGGPYGGQQGSYPVAPQGYPPSMGPGPAAPGYPSPPGYSPPNNPAGSYPAGAYGASSYGPGYGPGPARPDRPGMVTAAAVLAFVFGGFAAIGSAVVLLASSVLNYADSLCTAGQLNDPQLRAANCAAVGTISTGFLKVVSVGLIIVAILLIWGGVWAVTGKSQQLLVIGSGVYVVLAVASMIAGGSVGSGIVGMALAVLILVFLFNPASRAWFRARGAKIF